MRITEMSNESDAQSHFQAGDELYRQGRYNEACREYEQGVVLDPNNAAAWNNWGVALRGLGKPQETIEKFVKALDIAPDYALAYYNWGNAYYDLKKYDEAIAKYQEGATKKPDFAEAYNAWGNALLALEKYEAAIEKYHQAVKINPDLAEAYNGWGNALYSQKKYDEALVKYQEATTKKPDFSLAYCNGGNALLGLEKYEAAIEKYHQAVKINPDLAEAYNGWGNALYYQQKYDEAFAKYQEATTKKPDFALAYCNGGNALLGLEKYEAAIEKYHQAVKINPDLAEAYNGWGNALYALKSYDEAIAQYEEAAAKNPDYAEAYNNWGNALYYQKKYDEAIAKYQEATAKKPDYANPYYNWGNALNDLKSYDEAIEKYRQATKINPEFADAYYNWGLSYAALNKNEEAIEKYQVAMARKPDSAANLFAWGNALLCLGRFPEALERYQKARDIDPDYIYAYHNAAFLLNKQGRYKEARGEWTKFLDACGNVKRRETEVATTAEFFRFYGGISRKTFGELEDAEKLEDAERLLKAGLERYPDNMELLSEWLDLYLDKRDELGGDKLKVGEKAMAHREARETYLKLQKILQERLSHAEDAKDSDALMQILMQLGDLLVKMEDFGGAEKYLRRALNYQGKDVFALYSTLGVLYSRIEYHQEAVHWFAEAMKLEPDDLTQRCNLAEAYRKVNKVDLAEVEYNKVLRITPDQVEAHIGLGGVYSAMGDDTGDSDLYNKAVRCFTRGLELGSSDQGSKKLKGKELAAVLYSRGYARVKLYETSKTLREERDLRQAKDDFNRCSGLDEDNHKAKRAAQKIEKSLSLFRPQRLLEKIGPLAVFGTSLLLFLATQALVISHYYRDFPKIIDKGVYIGVTFGSMVFMIAGLYLPQILKLKVPGFSIEKSSVDQVTTPGTLGIEKGKI